MSAVLGTILFAIGTMVGSLIVFFSFKKNKVEKSQFDFIQLAKNSAEQKVQNLELNLNSEREQFNQKIHASNQEIIASKENIARLEAEKKNLDEKNKQHKEDLAELQSKFTLQFENLANRIFEEKTAKFKKDSEAGLSQILTPFKDRIQEFEKKVNDSFSEHSKEQFSLKESIKSVVDINQQMTTQTVNLTNALKGDKKLQGNWGETILEKILEASGLRKDDDYTIQAVGMGLTNSEGNSVKPDIIVNLPDKKHIIIDSKVSLVHYELYFSSADETEKETHLKSFLRSVRDRINELSSKAYQDTSKLAAPDFVLLFMPIEGAYALAVQQDITLQSYAWDRRIVLVCPATLFATLRTVASVWRIEQQNKNTLEIAKQGGALVDQISSFVKEMEALGKKIDGVSDTYDEALKKLTTGRGNVLKRAQDLQNLGVKVKKSLPSQVANDEDTGIEDQIALEGNLDEDAA